MAFKISKELGRAHKEESEHFKSIQACHLNFFLLI